MAMSSVQISGVIPAQKAFTGRMLPQRAPFTSTRAASQLVRVNAQQAPSESAMKVLGAFAAAQLVLSPLEGAAFAQDSLSIGAVGANPAEQFAKKSINKAKSVTPPDLLNSGAKSAKGLAVKSGAPADPLKDLQKKAKTASKSVGNPAADFANKSKKAVARAPGKVANPAKEFAAKAEKASKKVKGGLPLATIGWNTSELQTQVLFGFGEKKADQAVNKVSKAADKAGGAAQDVAKKADDATPDSFSIFDAGSVDQVRQQLKKNLEAENNGPKDPAERVASVGKPGESQEDNAERIRREAEGNTPGGDARSPTESANSAAS